MKKIVSWIIGRISIIPSKESKLTVWMMVSLWITTTGGASIFAIGNTKGGHLWLEIMKVIAFHTVFFALSMVVIGLVFSMLYIPLPKMWLGSLVYSTFAVIVVLESENSGNLFSIIMGLIFSILSLFIGVWLFFLFHKKIRIWVKVAITLLISLGLTYVFLPDLSNEYLSKVNRNHVTPLSFDNPGEHGNYSYAFLTYGSGKDPHRKEFGKEVSIITPSVDATHLVTEWSSKREEFWGFDQSNLPLNGRMWIPEGRGPFPIIFMVHGNHAMEDFSTSGYNYLGELFASRGFIAVSVDEDFINFSNVSGSPNNNYELRAWIMLKHLIQVKDLTQNPTSSLFGKVDLDKVALIGHSRGGQAVAMAADYQSFFPDDPALKGIEELNIQVVVGIAPTDQSVDGKKAYLKNKYYFLLHGARDGDLNDFRGDRQYARTSFDQEVNLFKASLYIADANHSQFNTKWGRKDNSLPRGLFLSQKQTISPENQRNIAKVYLSALMEVAFHEKEQYIPLFQDFRYGQNWIPDTLYINKYEGSSYKTLVQFEEGDKESFSAAEGFVENQIITPKDRIGNNRLQDALQLEWVTNAQIKWDLSNQWKGRPESLVVTLANIDEEADQENPVALPEIYVELMDIKGETVMLPLEQFLPVPPVIKTDYTIFGWFDEIFREGKYEASWEPVFQSFHLPISLFEMENSEVNFEEIEEMSFYFKNKPGKILIEKIGISE
ncbi:hypothetical protein RZN25_12455 [Bacillaceae bacterium S4-13-56]